ncbi:MAG: RNA polymerase sigma factor [Candidatus Sungbacteria bacterium]|nr:RNA polymerase sigma factor [Candidatus Sungbacteria bacterium]
MENSHDEVVLEGPQRDPRLVEILVRKYQAPFFRTAMRVVHNKQDAEDIVQEAFLKIYSKAHLFKKREGASLKSWIYAILVNTAISHIRKHKQAKSKELQWDPVLDSVLPDPEGLQEIEKREVQSVLAGVLGELPPELRTVLEMRYFEDESYKTIAAKSNISLENVKIRIHRAKKAAREILRNLV